MQSAQPFTEDKAWTYLRVFLEDFTALFGKPIALARWLDFKQRDHKVASAWLRALEAWLRRLLLIAASRITPPPQSESKKRPPREHPIAGASFASDDSADWRVSFQLNASRAQRTNRKRGKRYPRHFWDPVPLALRFEALLRAAQNPEPYAQRMARALAKNAKLPNALFRQKLKNMSTLRPYVAQCSFLVLEQFPQAWRPLTDTS